MDEQTFEEIFKVPMRAFDIVLNEQTNHRILFSGKFGSGKTSFLEYYFNQQVQQVNFKSEDYQSYWISPVNYSISSNENIFRYIKFDLIMQLLKKGEQPREVDIRAIDTLPNFVSEIIDEIISTILYMVPKVGKEISDYYDKIITLYKDLKKFAKKTVQALETN